MDTQAIVEVLEGNPFFSGLNRDIQQFLAANATERKFETGDVAFAFGQSADTFYLVLDGKIAVQVAALEGPPLELQKLGQGEVLGWSWLIKPYRWNFQARAQQPSRVLEFDGLAIRSQCDKDPAFGYAVLSRFSALMSERLDSARRRMMEAWRPAGFA